MSSTDVVALNEIRATLEGYAAAKAAQNLDRDWRDRLEALEGEIDRSVPYSIDQYAAYNSRFHQLIADLSGNAHLPEFLGKTHLAVFRLQFVPSLERARASREEHRRLRRRF